MKRLYWCQEQNCPGEVCRGFFQHSALLNKGITCMQYVRKHHLLLSTGSDSHSHAGRMSIKHRAEISRDLLERVGIQVQAACADVPITVRHPPWPPIFGMAL